MCHFFQRKKERPLSKKDFSSGEESHVFSFNELPQNFAEFLALKESMMSSPFQSAACLLLAYCAYRYNPGECFRMLSYLKAPSPLSDVDRSWIETALKEGKDYKPYSYFKGACPNNDYLPEKPFTFVLVAHQKMQDHPAYCTLSIRSNGDNEERIILLRQRKDGSWASWEDFLLGEVVAPRKDNPWL
jgi:hypothetical protein